MANTFSFVGVLKSVKDKENFKSFTVKNYDSGWMSERLVFNVICGDNVQMVEINSGRWADESKNVIYGFTKSENGKKGEPFQIPWSKRNDPEMIEKMAGFRVYTVDLDTRKHRAELEKAGDNEALEASNKKRKHFLAQTEFCEYVNKVVNSEKFKDIKFRVNGNVVYTYSASKGMYYVNYEVTKIYRAEDDAEPSSEVDIDFFFTHDTFDDSDYEETGKAIASGYTQFYDSMTKRNWFCPLSLVVRDNKVPAFKKKFSKFEDDEVRKIGLMCEKINGAQKVEVKYEDLDEETRENLDLGITTMEDVIRERGGSMYGDRIQELRIDKLGRGYTKGSETTLYTLEDMIKKPTFEKADDDIDSDIDIFDDDEL